ncbi:MAG: NAD(+) synthase, partial [Candidatus Levybacteria bacterium RIFCSPHIGHO2_12_FULL_39_9]
MRNTLKINPSTETVRITAFIKGVLKKQKFKNVVIGLSGGIDSAVSLTLLEKSIPQEDIFVAHLYYFESQINSLKPLLQKLNIPEKNILNISIQNAVDELKKILNIPDGDRIRLGNVMARIRMTMLYDLAKKNNALVLGTEDKSEFLLGYFTRFGDEASDIEPIRHLYKTQVYQLAEYLGVPKNVLKQKPSPGLWNGHTAEKELGFSYEEADNVLHLYFDQKKIIGEIVYKDFS